ncbi:hypothetical protein BCF46_0704 [Litoreibacter meonggei]|uniref:Uncharacterized protein n=1 Tax=Litoreibacter meonggei TaxID=1049199 RepID=A0A497X6J0_9RHOB|nr:hypothetical protein [Litoreibacter meonggei]RLJ60503.1 hypothetical protein BCF46_0704 [Litoreibacter meonggei]
MGNERVSILWKEVGGIRYSMLQSPTSSAYVPGEDIKFFGEHNYNPKGPTGADSTKKFGKLPRGKRVSGKIAPMRNPFAKPAVPHTSAQRRVGVGQGATSAAAEVGLMAISRHHLNSINDKLWRTLQNMSDEIVAGIKMHGGVLIVGRVSMMPTPNPETNMRQTFFYDAYIKDGAKTIDELYTPEVQSNAAPSFVGPQPWDGLLKSKSASASAREYKYPSPKPWVAPAGYMVLGEYLVFATSVTNKWRRK